MTQNNEREAVVRWLRELAVDCPPVIDKFILGAATSIQRGDHLENTNDTN